MSGNMVPKLRIVRCPKCRQLLSEPTGYDVYKCGGCDTQLQAKKKSMAVNSESGIQEIDAAPRKNPVRPPREDSLKEKATTSSRESYLDGNDEYNGSQLVPFKFSDEEREDELDIYKLSLRRHRKFNKHGSSKIASCEIEEIDNGNLSLERPEEGDDEELFSGSDEEDANEDKSVSAGANHGVEDLNNVNISLLDGDSANNDKSALVGDNHEGETTGNNIAGEKSSNEKLLAEGAEPDINILAPDGEETNNDQSAIEDAKSEVDTTESTTTKNPNTEKGSILHVTPGKLEESTPRVPVSPSSKQQKQAWGNVHRNADRARSVDTLDTTESRDRSSELSGVFGKLSKPPTTRSSYAYTEGRARKGEGIANSSSYGDLGTQRQPHISNENQYVMKESRRNQNKVLETTSYGIPRSRIPLHRSSSQTRYERDRPSNEMHNQLYHSTGFLSQNSTEDTDQEKMKLLRMIYKLQDQLNKTRYPGGETNGRLSGTRGVSYKGNHVPAYHSHDLLEGRYSYHPRCDGRCAHEITWRERHKYSRIPYSAEATSPAHHVDRSCLHCGLHALSNSPRHVLSEDLYWSYGGQDCCSSNCSYSSSPQWFTSSKLPLYDSESKYDDQRHMADKAGKYFREKQNLTKRHQRPVAGGAPFITCHKCLKLLQLPGDFLLYKKACHQIKCGECSEVLKFSLKNGSHIVSFPSNEVISATGSNLPSTSHANYYQYSPAKPISYYDDYGLSVSQSYSSEGDHVFLAQCNSSNGGEYVNPSVSRSSTLEEKITSRPQLKETDESAEYSSNMSTEKEARPQLRSSLHKLMGYSTPSQVIRGTSEAAKIENEGVLNQIL